MSVAQAVEVVMPRLSDSMEEGTIVRWLKRSGQSVSRGEAIAEIETDKATMEFEAEADGVLEIVAQEGDTLPLGSPIARLLPPGSTPAAGGGGATAAPEPSGGPSAGDAGRAGAAANGASSGARATPLARRLARDLGIDLRAVTPSGRRGQIMKADVLAAAAARDRDGDRAAAPAPAPAAASESASAGARPGAAAVEPSGAKGEVTVSELSRLQRTVASRMSESRATVPDFTLEVDIDMGACVDLRERLKEHADPAPSLNDMVVKACALTLRDHPNVNAAYRDGRFERYGRVNVGVAVAGEDALIVPVVRDADRKSLGEIARSTRELARRVREGTIEPPDLAGGTFTVSNLGMFGITRFAAVINPPQAAILAVGAVEERPVVRDGRIAVGRLMTVSLSSDHRILYGADAARFLADLRARLEAPLTLLL